MEKKMLKIRQIKSTIGSPPKVKRTMQAIGFHHHYQVLIKQDTPQLRGMLHHVRHLVEVSEEKAVK
jgi:large subunit ribosomal protein L30